MNSTTGPLTWVRNGVRGQASAPGRAIALLLAALVAPPCFGFGGPWDPLWDYSGSRGGYDDWGGSDWFGEGVWGGWMPFSRRGRSRGLGRYGDGYYGYGDPYGYGAAPRDRYRSPYLRDYGADRYRGDRGYPPRDYGDEYRYRYEGRPPWWDDYHTLPRDSRSDRRRYYDEYPPPGDPWTGRGYDRYADPPVPDRGYEDRGYRDEAPYVDRDPPAPPRYDQPYGPTTEQEGWRNEGYRAPAPGAEGSGSGGDPWDGDGGPVPPPPSPW